MARALELGSAEGLSHMLLVLEICVDGHSAKCFSSSPKPR